MQDKTTVIVITLVVLTLIYLDNSGRLPAAMQIVRGGGGAAPAPTGTSAGSLLPPFVLPAVPKPTEGSDGSPVKWF